MPTYDYLCDKCHDRFEQRQSIMDEALSHCPKCKGSVKRLISRNVGISFKGSGFYVTDSRQKSSSTSSSAKASSKVSSKASSKASAKKKS